MSAAKPIPLSQADLRRLLRYDPKTGFWYWLRPSARSGLSVGQRAGCIHHDGYVYIGIGKRYYCAHRLAWIYMTGTDPGIGLDHANGKKSDNRWSNLRKANQSQNSANRRRSSNNTSGVKGVSWIVSRSRFRASIRVNGKLISLGTHKTRADAARAYTAAANKFFGRFARPAGAVPL